MNRMGKIPWPPQAIQLILNHPCQDILRILDHITLPFPTDTNQNDKSPYGRCMNTDLRSNKSGC